MAPALTKAAILDADDLPRKRVDVPEWGGVVYVRSMTGAERDAFNAALIDAGGDDGRVNFANLRAGLVALTVVDENGARLFEDGDAEALDGKSFAALDRVASAAQRLNALSDDDVDALVKNSDAGPKGASSSRSRANSA